MELLQSKGKHFTKAAEDFKLHLVEGEKVLASVQIGLGMYLLTQFRLVVVNFSGGIKASIPLADIQEFRFESNKHGNDFFITQSGQKENKLGTLLKDVSEPFAFLFSELHGVNQSSPELRTESFEAAEARYSQIPTNRRKERLPRALVKAIMRNSKSNEDPLMLITGQHDSTAGSLIIYEDRCVVTKYGLTLGMPGSYADGVFSFKEITGIEYNKGLVIGYLEVLTAAYKGSINSNFVTSVLTSKGMSNNAIQMSAEDYASAKPLIEKLLNLVDESKHATNKDNSNPKSSASLTSELEKLAQMFTDGLLSAEEYKLAKSKLLDGQ